MICALWTKVVMRMRLCGRSDGTLTDMSLAGKNWWR
jgi:hypothetical protein